MTVEGDLIVVLPPYMSQPLDYYYSNATDGTIELGANTGEDRRCNPGTIFRPACVLRGNG